MRPITKTMSLFAAAVALTAALPMSGAAAAVDAFLKLGDIKGEAAGSARIGHEVVVQSWSWGETQTSARVNKIDSFTIKQRTAPSATAYPGDAASGLATGKRQHKPLTFSKPLDRGSLSVKVPAGQCTLGTHYTTATLTTRYMTYELKEVIVTSCAMSGGGGGDPVPTESISFNYDKIQMVTVPMKE